jgi:O-antigen/teichoic acid export membrane protein
MRVLPRTPHRGRVSQRLARGSVRHRHLIAGSAWLIAATVTAALGGFVFWLVAAHVDSTTTVGRASALFTSAQFLNYATGMGLPVAVARYAHDRTRDTRVLLEWGLLYTAATSVVGTAVFFVFAPHSLAAPLLVGGHALGFALFAIIVTGMSFTLIVDMRLMALRRWGWVFGRALLVSVVRMPFVWFHPFGDRALWLLVLVGGTQAASGLVGALALQGRVWHALLPLPANAARVFRYASVNYLGQLAIQAPFFVLPVIVLLKVRPATNAVFYISWSVMAVVLLSVQMVSQALLSEGSKEGARLAPQLRVTLCIALGFAGFCSVIAYLGADSVTSLYGAAYSHAAHLLPILVLATVPWAVTVTLLAEARIRENSASTVAISVAFALAVLVPAVFLTTHNAADSAARAWLEGNAVAACIAIVVSVASQIRRGVRASRVALSLEPLAGSRLGDVERTRPALFAPGRNR